MNTNDFIQAIKRVVSKNTLTDMVEVLESPPGRSPEKNLLMLSEWFNNKSDLDKTMIVKLIEMSIDEAIFGFLCVIDGVRAIEEGEEKGNLYLHYIKEDEKILLNNSDDDYLHDIYNSL